MPYDKNKHDYLVAKLIDGGVVLRDLFDGIIKNPSSNPRDVGASASSHYQLTQSQKQKLEDVVAKISNAKEIINSIRQEYGITKKGLIKDKKRLYADVYGTEAPQHFWVKVFPFALGFYLPARFLDKRNLGQANGEPLVWIDMELFDEIGAPIDLGDVGTLSFCVNYEDLKTKSFADVMIHHVKKVSQRYVGYHELKHIIDKFLDINDRLSIVYALTLKELSADLYSCGLCKSTLVRDVEKMQRLADAYQQVIDEHKKTDTMPLEAFEQLFKQVKMRLCRAQNFPGELIEGIIKKGIDKRTLSYIVASTDVWKLEHRLRLIHDYLDRHPTQKMATL